MLAQASLLVLFLLFIGLVDRGALAATFNEPSAQPPGGNIPMTVWNRLDTTEKQRAASIEIDGGGPAENEDGTPSGAAVGVAVGDVLLDMGTTHAGQNLYYGFAPFANMHREDRLLLLQTTDAGVWTDRASVDREGNLYVSGCFGPVLRGLSSVKYNGNLNGLTGGYFAVNSLCAASFGDGSHVCSVAEILNSIKCAVAGPEYTSKIKDSGISGVDAWIMAGPPGYTAPANDCQGWRSNNKSNLGRIWRFDADTGGQGFLTTCNQSAVLTCCN